MQTKLLLQTVRSVITGNIQLAIEGDEPWANELVFLFYKHFLGMRFCRLFSDFGYLTRLPEATAALMTQEAWRSLQRNQKTRGDLLQLSSVFEKEGIAFAVLKGWSLAQRLYAQPEERYYQDCDLLFKREDRSRVCDLLASNHFQMKAPYGNFRENRHKEEFESLADPSLLLECHFGLAPPNFLAVDPWLTIQQQDFCTPELTTPLTLLHLDPYTEYLYLVYHGAVQHRFQRLGWLMDLARFHQLDLVDPNQLRVRAAGTQLALAVERTLSLLQFSGVPIQKVKPLSIKGQRMYIKIIKMKIEDSLRSRLAARSYFHPGGLRAALGYAHQHLIARLRAGD